MGKSEFLSWLKQLLDELGYSCKQNLISGFKACGIVPCSIEPLLKRLPDKGRSPATCAGNLSESLIELLSEMRGTNQPRNKPGRRKKVAVEPGKSITSYDLNALPTQSSNSGPLFQLTSTDRSPNFIADNDTDYEIQTGIQNFIPDLGSYPSPESPSNLISGSETDDEIETGIQNVIPDQRSYPSPESQSCALTSESPDQSPPSPSILQLTKVNEVIYGLDEY